MPILSKREVFEHLLEEGTLIVVVDTGRAGVDVPAQLADSVIALNFGLDLPVPIADLSIDDRGVCATLSFDRKPYFCTVPWNAVHMIALVDGRQAVQWAAPEEQPMKPEEPKLRIVS